MLRRAGVLGVLAVSFLLSACGPSGKINGRVVVEGGSAAGVLVRILGPTSVGVVTDDVGNFKAEALPDGSYQVIADVPNTDVSTQRAMVKVANGTAPDVTLTFKASVGVVEGKVLFSDGSDSAGLTVTLSGTESRGVQTATGGTFRFEGLKAGSYAVAVEVPDSRERRQALTVLVGAGSPAGPLPDLTFTLTGTLTGNVKAGTTNAPGAIVEVPGTDRTAVTDGGGNFILYDVPTGARTVQARLNAAVASQQVTVARGANPALAFTLQTALTGRVEGTVGFVSSVTDTLIRVSAAGTTWTTTAAVNGEWSLTLPPGTWEIVADAPNYPRKSLGLAVVSPGQTTTLPGAKLSIYRKMPWEVSVGALAPLPLILGCEGDYILAGVQTVMDTSLLLVNHNTLSRRVLSVGSFLNLELSAKCKYAAWSQGTNIFIQELATGAQRIFAGPPTDGLKITSDEAFLFFRVGTTLHRVNLSTWQDDTFSAASYVRIGRERYLVSSSITAPVSYTLVTRSGTSAAFGAVGELSYTDQEAGTAWATTNCTTVVPITCTLQVLAPTATAPVSVSNPAQVPQNPGFDSNNSTRDWLHFTSPGGSLFSILVKSDTAQAVAMPQGTFWIRFSPTGSRVAYMSTLTLGQALREEVVPPSGTVATATTTNASFDANLSGWVSNTRLMVWDTATVARRLDFKNGVMTADSDVTGPIGTTVKVAAGAVTWARTSSGKRVVVIGDSADFVLETPGVTTPFGVRLSAGIQNISMLTLMGTSTVTAVAKSAAVSNDANSAFVVDAVRNEVRKVTGFYASGGSGYAYMLPMTGASGVANAMLMPTTDQVVVAPDEMGTLPASFPALLGPQGAVFLARDINDARAVLLAKLNPTPP